MISTRMRAQLMGMSVSVDVSNGEHDISNRYFGTITEVMDGDEHDKGEVVLLVQDATPNFSAVNPMLREALQTCLFALGRLGGNVAGGPGRAAWEAARDALAKSRGA